MIWLFDREGASYRARVDKIEANETQLTVLEKSQTEPQMLNIILAQAALKQKGMELVLQKSTELGAYSVVPIIAARTMTKLEGNVKNKLERWSRIMREAAKQCGRSTLPELHLPMTLKGWLEKPQDTRKLVLWEEAEMYLKDVILSELSNTSFRGPASTSVIILVGPEGGWTKREQKDILERGYEAVALGDNILRAETAAITSLAIISHFWNT